MSKPIKNMMVADYRRRFDGVSNALLVDIRGIEANENNAMRQDLHASGIRITVVRNKLARDAFKDTDLEALVPGLEGPSAMCYGGDSVVEVARSLVDWAKKVKELDLKGACLDGEYFDGHDGVKRLSTFPTRDEAQAKVVQLVLSPAGNVLGAATSAGSNVMGIVKEIQERLEKGEEIAKVG
ncbi:MAG: 50S ribosomal protein L10 [Phycisphaerales bacterium]|jgi:large subunit ribosomal protein L10|nr:50S ribosomal protein L10 [Phycisphaerales bacterium]